MMAERSQIVTGSPSCSIKDNNDVRCSSMDVSLSLKPSNKTMSKCDNDDVKRNSKTLATEYHALTDFASRLGAYLPNRHAPLSSVASRSSLAGTPPLCCERSSSLGSQYSEQGQHQDQTLPGLCTLPTLSNNDGEEAENVREEAELLLSFMSSVPAVIESQGNMEKERASQGQAIEDIGISPSFSFESKKHFEFISSASPTNKICSQVEFSGSRFEPKYSSIPRQNMSVRPYSFSCSSLSLKCDPPVNESSTISSSGAMNPPELFSRLLYAEPNFDVRDMAEKLAANAMNSFVIALDWRAKTWIKSLAKALHLRLKYSSSKKTVLQGCSTKNEICSKPGTHNIPTTQQQVNTDSDVNVNSSSSSLSSTPSRSTMGETKSHTTFDYDELISSKEARVIESLTQAASSVVVRDVRTTFQVMEQQLTSAETKIENKEACYELDVKDTSSPPQKKRRIKLDYSQHTYKLSHAINLESTFTVSTNSEKNSPEHRHLTISFQTPGAIHGTFTRDNKSNGEVTLTHVDVTLDTEELALSMEKNSRLVMRAAAEENMTSPRSCELSSPLRMDADQDALSCDDSVKSESSSESEYSEGGCSASVNESMVESTSDNGPSVSQIRHSIPSTQNDSYQYTPTPISSFSETRTSDHSMASFNPAPPFPTAALVTPHPYSSPPSSNASCESENMPPPPPRLPLEDGECNKIHLQPSYTKKGPAFGLTINPRRVSPLMTQNAAIGVSTSLTTSTAILGLNDDSSNQLLSTPSFVKKTYYKNDFRESHEEEHMMKMNGISTQHLQKLPPSLVSPNPINNSDGLEKRVSSLSNDSSVAGLSLPALVEVACAAIHAS